jgi:hypothetical protein
MRPLMVFTSPGSLLIETSGPLVPVAKPLSTKQPLKAKEAIVNGMMIDFLLFISTSSCG